MSSYYLKSRQDGEYPDEYAGNYPRNCYQRPGNKRFDPVCGARGSSLVTHSKCRRREIAGGHRHSHGHAGSAVGYQPVGGVHGECDHPSGDHLPIQAGIVWGGADLDDYDHHDDYIDNNDHHYHHHGIVG